MHGRVALVTGGSGGIGAELSIRLAAELSVRLAADGVTGNAIAPALIADTAMLPGDPGELAAGFRSASSPRCSRATPASSPPHSGRRVHRDAPERPRRARRRVPVGRLGRPEEVADLMLAVLRTGYITNQVISSDGRMHPR